MSEVKKEKKGLDISAKTFLAAIAVIFALMVLTYVLSLIVPMAQLFGLPAQLCVMAFAFGDGFSNVFYPTNAALLIGLGLSDISYVKWVKWSWKFQLANLLLTSGLLLLGLAIGYC